MRVCLCIVALLMGLSVLAVAAEPTKVSVNVENQLLSVVAARMATEAGVNIVVDPSVDSKISVSFGESELPQALDAVTKAAKVSWKKVQFAKPADTKVTLEQVKSSIIALAAMPIIAASFVDSSGKGAMFARELPSNPDTSALKLPEGYTWSTAYVIYSAVPPVAAKPKDPSSAGQTNSIGSERLNELMNMNPTDRAAALSNEVVDMMTLAPEVRQQLLREQLAMVRKINPKMLSQYKKDMDQAMRSVTASNKSRPSSPKPAVGTPRR